MFSKYLLENSPICFQPEPSTLLLERVWMETDDLAFSTKATRELLESSLVHLYLLTLTQ